MKIRANAFILAMLTSGSLTLTLQRSAATVIMVQFDDNAGGKHNDAKGQGAVGEANFGDYAPFSSRAFNNGSLVKNASDITLQDLHLKLTSGDTFDPKSTGGAAFPTTMLSDDKKEIWFSGGNIKPGDSFWSLIPKSADFEGGVGKYQGRATPMQAKMPDEKKSSVAPKTGNDPTTQINYDGAGNFTFAPGHIDFVEYSDGTVIHADTAFESIIGSNIAITPMQLQGLSSDLPGAFDLSGGAISIESSSQIFLTASLGDVLLIPDNSVPGFDSVLQATLLWPQHQVGLTSQYLDESFALLGPGVEENLAIYTDLLAATGDLTHSGSGVGTLDVNMTIPEPSSWSYFAIGSLVLGACLRWRTRT